MVCKFTKCQVSIKTLLNLTDHSETLDFAEINNRDFIKNQSSKFGNLDTQKKL